jgi:tungstate transport system permease protein
MHHIIELIKQSWPLIEQKNGIVRPVLWNTITLAMYSTAGALILGLPAAMALALGRFRGRRVLQALANASLGLPSVVVGAVVLEIFYWPLKSWHWAFTMKAVYVAQTILALPYVVALIPAAVQGLPPEMLAQARLLGAGRLQLATLALREARIGVWAAVIAAFGAGLSEVGAITIVAGCGGSSGSLTATLGCGIIPAIKSGGFDGVPGAVALGETLLGLVLLLTGVLTILQQRRRRHGRRPAPLGVSAVPQGRGG